MNNRFAVEEDGRIVTNTTRGIQTPQGTAADRTALPANGELRYNNDIGVGGELEVYVNGVWEIVKTNRHATVTKQEFNNGDYSDTIFGPLAYNIDVNKPENLTVYVENVYQIPGMNYELTASTVVNLLTVSTNLTEVAPVSTNTLYLNSIADFNIGLPISGTGILSGTIITNSDIVFNSITLSAAIDQQMTTASTVTVTYPTGTYVKFYENATPVPYKPVITLLGLDGYCPPFEV